MSAANASIPSPTLQEEMRAHEPSMEEILASIRRIIADDESLPGARRRRDAQPASDEESPAAAAPSAAAPEPAAQPVAAPTLAPVADIRPIRAPRPAPDPVAAPQPAPEPIAEEILDDEEVFFEPLTAEIDEAAEVEAEVEFETEEYAAEALPEATGAPLVSADAASAIASHFQTLAASMVINESGLLQKYAQEMLRPMLKQWLDDNLPVIVERLVRAEIERVARGGRR